MEILLVLRRNDEWFARQESNVDVDTKNGLTSSPVADVVAYTLTSKGSFYQPWSKKAPPRSVLYTIQMQTHYSKPSFFVQDFNL